MGNITRLLHLSVLQISTEKFIMLCVQWGEMIYNRTVECCVGRCTEEHIKMIPHQNRKRENGQIRIEGIGGRIMGVIHEIVL